VLDLPSLNVILALIYSGERDYSVFNLNLYT
jgi:hypothetical protein